MTTLPSPGRPAAIVAAAAALVFGLAACTSSVAKDDVAASIKTKLDGQPVDAVATVKSIDGSTANYDITTEARPVAKVFLRNRPGSDVADP